MTHTHTKQKKNFLSVFVTFVGLIIYEVPLVNIGALFELPFFIVFLHDRIHRLRCPQRKERPKVSRTLTKGTVGTTLAVPVASCPPAPPSGSSLSGVF